MQSVALDCGDVPKVPSLHAARLSSDRESYSVGPLAPRYSPTRPTPSSRHHKPSVHRRNRPRPPTTTGESLQPQTPRRLGGTRTLYGRVSHRRRGSSRLVGQARKPSRLATVHVPAGIRHRRYCMEEPRRVGDGVRRSDRRLPDRLGCSRRLRRSGPIRRRRVARTFPRNGRVTSTGRSYTATELNGRGSSLTEG